MFCGKGWIGQFLCKHRKSGSECTALFVCHYAENFDGLNVIDMDAKRKNQKRRDEKCKKIQMTEA